jgi:hypothetical protein
MWGRPERVTILVNSWLIDSGCTGFAVGVGEHRVARSDVVSVVALPIAPLSEDVFGVGVEFEAASAGARFGGKLGRSSSECLTGAADRQLVQGSVPVAPSQPRDLTAAHPGGGGEMQRRVEPMPGGRAEEGGEFGGGPCFRAAAWAGVRSWSLGA